MAYAGHVGYSLYKCALNRIITRWTNNDGGMDEQETEPA